MRLSTQTIFLTLLTLTTAALLPNTTVPTKTIHPDLRTRAFNPLDTVNIYYCQEPNWGGHCGLRGIYKGGYNLFGGGPGQDFRAYSRTGKHTHLPYAGKLPQSMGADNGTSCWVGSLSEPFATSTTLGRLQIWYDISFRGVTTVPTPINGAPAWEDCNVVWCGYEYSKDHYAGEKVESSCYDDDTMPHPCPAS